MATIKKLLDKKQATLFSVPPTASVYEALSLMANKNIGSVVVMQGEDFLGIFSERDYARKVILEGKTSATTKVEEVMEKTLPTLSLEDTVDACMQLMTEKNLRYLPVLKDNKLIGIISQSDIVKQTIEAQKNMIDHLHDYIHSK